jgi:hypothetical protein
MSAPFIFSGHGDVVSCNVHPMSPCPPVWTLRSDVRTLIATKDPEFQRQLEMIDEVIRLTRHLDAEESAEPQMTPKKKRKAA